MLTNRKHTYILFLIYLLISSVYLINNPIEFQCDSALFYNYASGIIKFSPFVSVVIFLFIIILVSLIFLKKRIIFSSFIKKKKVFFLIFVSAVILIILNISTNTHFPIIDLKRPPVYPLFLILSGTFLFDSFIPLIAVQLFLSFIIVILINEILILNLKSSNIAFIFTILFSLTSIPYILIKFLIAEQLLFFCTVLTYYLLSNYTFKNKDKYLYISIVVATLAWLTKWEGVLLFLSVTFFIILNINNFKHKKIFKLISFFIIPFLILSSWTITRSLVSNDFTNITSVSNSNSDQLFYKTYGVITSEYYNYKKELGLDTSGAKVKEIVKTETFLQVIKKDNGKYSNLLFDSIKEYLIKNPNSYKSLEKPLSEAYSKDPEGVDFYFELFGKFDGDIDKITKNIFEQPNIYYFNFVNMGLDKFLGTKKKNEIINGAMKEAYLNEPQLLIISATNFFEANGVNLKNFFLGKNIFSGLSDLDFINPFNAGKCAENNLTNNMFKEYKKSHQNRDAYSFLNLITKYTDNINDIIRDYLGLVIILSMVYLIIFKNFKLFLSYSFFPLAYDFILGITVAANRNTKYEVITFTCKYIMLSIFIGYIIKFILKKYNEKQRES